MSKENLSNGIRKHWRPLATATAILISVLFLASNFQPAELNIGTATASTMYYSQGHHDGKKMRIVTDNVPYVVQNASFSGDWQLLGQAPGDMDMIIELYLGLNHVNLLENYVNQISNPGSPLFQHYMSPNQFKAIFSPSTNGIRQIENFYQNAGFTVWNYSYAPTMIVLEGNISLIENVFQVQEYLYYFVPDDVTIVTNLQNPSVPAQFTDIFHVYGLSFAPFLGDPTYGGQSGPVSGILGDSGTPSGTSDVLTPAEVTSYFQVNQLFASGASGQNTKIGIIGVVDSLNMTSVNMFWDAYGIHHPTVNQIYLTDNGQSPYPEFGEADLDVEWIGAMAPNATIYYVMHPFDLAPTGDDAINLEFYYMLNVVDPNIVSCGFWLEPQMDYDASYAQIFTYMGLQAAAEGITVFTGSSDSHSPYLLNVMSSSYFVSVGDVEETLNETGAITSLYALNDPNYTFFGGLVGSGGGNSYFFEKPLYQVNGIIHVPATYTNRAQPDISMVAIHLVTTYQDYWYSDQFGGAYAVPITAGMFATIESGLWTHHSQSARLGWIQPILYNIGYGNHYGYPAYYQINYLYPGTAPGSDGYLGSGWNEYTGIGSIQTYNLCRDIQHYIALAR